MTRGNARAGVLAKQKSRPLVGVGSYVLAAVVGYCVSPLRAKPYEFLIPMQKVVTDEPLASRPTAGAGSRLPCSVQRAYVPVAVGEGTGDPRPQRQGRVGYLYGRRAHARKHEVTL